MAGKISPNARLLWEKLLSKGIADAQLEYWDKHKHIDIAVLSAKLYIEVDDIGHFINPDRIVSDFKREHYSDHDGFNTFFVTNQILEDKDLLERVVNALEIVIKERKDIVDVAY